MTNSDDENKNNEMSEENLNIITEKSNELLKYQLGAFDSNYGKAGTFISISSLFTPLAFSFFDKFDHNLLTIILFSIPIALNLIGLYYLVQVLIPKKLGHGVGLDEFGKLVNKNSEDVKLFVIGSNKTSFTSNHLILSKQNKFLRRGLRLVYFSAIALAVLFLTQTLIINQNKMADNNDSNSGNQTTQDDGNSGRQIPEVRPEQTTIIEKGGESGGENMNK